MTDRTLRRDDGSMVDVTDRSWTERVELDEDKAVTFYADGSVRFSHVCDRGPRGILRCAPQLQIGNGHTVVTQSPLTIVASVLCPDCHLHGFVRASRWVPA